MTTVGLSAIEIAERVRSGSVKPTAVVLDHLRQVEWLEPKVNAMLAQRPDKAIAEAAELEQRPDLKELPLAGVPVTIKDSVDVAGEPTRHGSLATPEGPRDKDDELVRRLREAGCVVIGKTNQPELAIWHFTQSKLSGVTRNPWNLDRAPGGSSGGAAASVASAMAPIAQGSDGLGSIRLPAAFCGLFGIKPGPGVVPVAGGGGEHWFGLSQWGPLATTVSDAALVLDVLAGTTRFRGVKAPAGPLRLALSTRAPDPIPVNRELRLAVEAAADALREAGHTVTVTDPPQPLNLPLYAIHRHLAGVANDVEELGLDVARLEPRTQRMTRIGRYLNRYHPVPANGTKRLYDRFATWFQDYDALLTPTTAQPFAAAAGWDRKGYAATFYKAANQVPFTQTWNVLSLPAASVPAGLSRDGLPLGVQLIAPRGGEDVVLSLAKQLEEIHPWPRHAPMAAVEGATSSRPADDSGVRRWFAPTR